MALLPARRETARDLLAADRIFRLSELRETGVAAATLSRVDGGIVLTRFALERLPF